MAKWAVIGLISAIVVASGQGFVGKPLSIEDTDHAVGISSPTISPDGKLVAAVVTKPLPEPDASERAIILIDVASGSERVLTHERRAVASPAWSPSGDRLGFLALAPNGHLQVYVMPMSGGDPERVTDSKDDVQQFAWRPDGKQIAFATMDAAPEKKGADKFHDAFVVGDNDFLQTEAPRPAHLWLVDSDGKNAKRLTSGSWTLPVSFPPGPPSSPISWSPDGQSIAIVKQDDPHSGQGDVTSVQILDIQTQKLRPLTAKTRLEGFPLISPDGQSVAYLYSKDGDWVQNNEFYIAPFSGGPGHSVTADLDRCPYRAEWMPDGKSLLVAGNDTTQVAYWIQPISGAARRMDLGAVCPTHGYWPQFSIAKDETIAFTANEPTRPTEVYVVRPGEKPRRLTDFNHDLDHRKIGETRLIQWRSDKFSINGTLTLPPDFDSAKKYPIVLSIHGGPNAASLMNFNLFAQVLATHGYLVFQPNYRGSDNLGNAFYTAITKDMGDGPGRDVMAGLEVVKKLPFADSSKIAVTGWSYGGYMTSWLIGHHTFWTCAVAGAPVTDFVDSYNLSDGNVEWRGSLGGGSPYVGDKMKDYLAQSPITYAPRAKTPTLIMCDTGDFRVPITQSYALYHALKDNGVVTQFVAYPVAGHFPGDRERTKDVDRRWLDWIDRYTGGKAP